MNPFSIYFPQFYPTKINNEVWGYGFTDWSLIANANLHRWWNRRAPSRGFYDGHSRDIHFSQIEEMKKFKLGGLGVYHYWFYSSQELDAMETTLLSSNLDYPWFLIWASEGWSKRWVGDPTSIINLADKPTQLEISRHCEYLARCFSQTNYYKVDGRPLFVIYNLSHFTNPADVVEKYRKAMIGMGFDIHIAHFVKNPFDVQNSNLVDATYLFEPRLYFGTQRVARSSGAKKAFDLFKKIVGDNNAARLLLMNDKLQKQGVVHSAEGFASYLKSADRAALIEKLGGPVQNVLTPGWNNTPRYREKFTALEDIDADVFADMLYESSKLSDSLPPLINAWNEWSEGASIEPCVYYGTRYLDAISIKF